MMDATVANMIKLGDVDKFIMRLVKPTVPHNKKKITVGKIYPISEGGATIGDNGECIFPSIDYIDEKHGMYWEEIDPKYIRAHIKNHVLPVPLLGLSNSYPLSDIYSFMLDSDKYANSISTPTIGSVSINLQQPKGKEQWH